MNMRIHVNGITMGVELHGEVGRPTLVLLHGFTGSAAGWGTHLDILTENGLFVASAFRVIALDMLGHGQSSAPADPQRYSIEHCRDDILAVLRQLGVRKGEAALLGYSMGGRIALYTAFSGFFRALILESASSGIEDAIERMQRRASDEALAERIERESVAAFVEYWEHLPLFASQCHLPFAQREALHAQRLQNSARGLAQSLRGVGTGVQPSLHARLASLDIPVLLIVGALDTKFCISARQMAQVLPQAQLCVVPNAGHTVHLEQPEAFDRIVKDFVIQSIV